MQACTILWPGVVCEHVDVLTNMCIIHMVYMYNYGDQFYYLGGGGGVALDPKMDT